MENNQSNINIFDVANYFINANYDPTSESFVTPLKLQKLCYYAQAHFIARYKKLLINQSFEAWVHGPVCPELYEKYKSFGMLAIEPEKQVNETVFDKEQLKILKFVQNEYGIYDGKFLEYVTHQESPWINARKGYRASERCNVKILEEDMLKFYAKKQIK